MTNQTIDNFSVLLSLQHEAREVNNLNDFSFLVVNETYQLVQYQSAALWQRDEDNTIRVLSLSGTSHVDPYTPTNQWLAHVLPYCYSTSLDGNLKALSKNELPEDIKSFWPEEIPKHLLMAPFYRDGQEITGGLLFINNQPWNDKQSRMLQWLLHAYTYSWYYLTGMQHKNPWRKRLLPRKRWVGVSLLGLLLASFFIPVKQTVLAPAEVIAKDPVVITAPMSGVIKDIHVSQNDTIGKNQLLVSMDKDELNSAHNLAQQELEVTQAQYRKAVQKGFVDYASRSELNILKAKLDREKLEVAYTNSLLNKADIKAPAAGIAILPHKDEWIGKPVVTGEKLLMLADPNKVELDIWLPVSDAVDITPGSTVKLFLNSDPLNPITATVNYTSFDAQLTTKQVLAYRIIAQFDQPERLSRIGAQGTAKMYGDKVSLFYYVMRRPISAVRQTLGV